MRLRLAALVLTASLVTAAPAQASTSFQFVNGGSVTAFGYYVGRYNGLEGTSPQVPVLLNCVDFFHHVADGQQWDANLSSIASGNGIGPSLNWTRSSDVTLYRKAAYLAAQYQTAYNNNDAASIGDIQATIWGLFPGNPPPPTPLSGTYWADQATNNYATYNYSGWFVVSDIRTGGPQDAQSVQEFIIHDSGFEETAVPAPEPATIILFGTGFLGLAGMRMRRKK